LSRPTRATVFDFGIQIQYVIISFSEGQCVIISNMVHSLKNKKSLFFNEQKVSVTLKIKN